jgi:RNA polymerase sigma-70 factor (ECF subfamily)
LTIEALRRHGPAALDEVLAVHGQEIQTVAYLILRDQSAAEDVVIETVMTAYERAGEIRDERAFRAWLLRVATNRALSQRRRGVKVVPLDLIPERAGPVDFGRRSTDRVALFDGLAELPPAMRAAIVLRYYADLPVDEIARALGKSPNTIKTQLREALARLRRSLDDGLVVPAPEANHA